MKPVRATCVVPVAGQGLRLGLPMDKELLPCAPGRVAIDATLDLLRPHSDVRVVLVAGPGRERTVEYVRAALPEHAIAAIAQHPDQVSSTGAVLSAANWFSPITLVLLPDQVLLEADGDPVASLLNHLEAGAPCCFLSSDEHDHERLANDGALTLIDDNGLRRVVAYTDRPPVGMASAYNAIWFGYGFRREHAKQTLSILHASTTGTTVTDRELRASPLWRAPAVDVGPCLDVGTWPAVLHLWRQAANEATA